MREPGAWARSKARRVRWSFIRRAASRSPWSLGLGLILLALIGTAAALVFSIAWRDGGLVLFGALVASFGFWVFHVVDRESGAASISAGAEAETSTRDELRKLAGHRTVNGLEFDGKDVDHVLVGPSGVWAVETKWVGGKLEKPDGLPHRRFHTYLGRAKWAAGRIDALVRKAGKVDVVVRPVLILWGPYAPRTWPACREVEEVLVLVGREGDQWREVFEGLELGDHAVSAALSVLEAQERAQRVRSSV